MTNTPTDAIRPQEAAEASEHDPAREKFRATVRRVFEQIDADHGDDAANVKRVTADLAEAFAQHRIGEDVLKALGFELFDTGDWRAVRAYLDALPQ